MCGIAGFYGSVRLGEDTIRKCLKTMNHRGPDAAHAQHLERPDGRHLHLLHSRLSIIDIDSRADQPFSEDPYLLSYNGELYNYLELRHDLVDQGVTFRTESDTEVFAKAIAVWGMREALNKAEGMWAFALFDKESGVLTLARDRFGEKPLYVMETPEGVYFGSEIKFIAALRGQWPALDLNHLKRYMVNGYKALHKTPSTFYEGLSAVTAGTSIEIPSGGTPRPERYWRPVFDKRDEDLSFDDVTAEVRNRLIDAVGIRLRADVPLAFCMSGGIDSNSLIAIAKRQFGYDVHGFTIVNTDARYAEQDMVESMRDELSLRHTEIALRTNGFLDALRRLVRHHDQPVSTISYYVHWLMMEAIHENGYKVSISGTGADELFSGYYDHHNAYLHDVRADKNRARVARADWERELAPIVRNPHLKNPDLFSNDPSFRGHIFLNADRFASFLLEGFDEPFREETYCGELLRNRMLNEMFHESVPVILQEDDLNAMAFSIENRSPFLDRKLFEFSLTIPTRHLIRDGRAKAVLREAMRGLVPDPILDNPRKVGFNAPIAALLDTRSPRVREQLLDDSPIFRHVRKDDVESLLDQDELVNSESKFLFSFLNAKMFLEERAS